jgi:hypothetical protein
MPAKLRASHAQLQFVDWAEDRFLAWSPTDLPELIASLAARHGIGFIDLAPAMVTETARSRAILYNTIYDSHLNARGSSVVAEEMARHIRGGGQEAVSPDPAR